MIGLDGGSNGLQIGSLNPDCLDKGCVTGADRHVGLFESQKSGDELFERLVGFAFFGWSRNGDSRSTVPFSHQARARRPRNHLHRQQHNVSLRAELNHVDIVHTD